MEDRMNQGGVAERERGQGVFGAVRAAAAGRSVGRGLCGRASVEKHQPRCSASCLRGGAHGVRRLGVHA